MIWKLLHALVSSRKFRICIYILESLRSPEGKNNNFIVFNIGVPQSVQPYVSLKIPKHFSILRNYYP